MEYWPDSALHSQPRMFIIVCSSLKLKVGKNIYIGIERRRWADGRSVPQGHLFWEGALGGLIFNVYTANHTANA